MSALTTPVQLTEHVAIIYAEFPHIDSGNVYLVTGAHPTLIDSGSGRTVPQLVDNLAQLGMTVQDIEQVIATHADYDHVQGFHGLHELNPSLRLLIHQRDCAIVQGANAYRTASYLYNRPFVSVAPEQCIPIADGDLVNADDTQLTVLHTPGHSDGSICLLGEIDGKRILFAGDTVGGSMKSLEGASLEVWANAVRTWRDSLARLSCLEFDWILTGHEPASSMPIERARFDDMVQNFGKMLNPWFSLGKPSPVLTTPQ